MLRDFLLLAIALSSLGVFFQLGSIHYTLKTFRPTVTEVHRHVYPNVVWIDIDNYRSDGICRVTHWEED